MTWVKICGITNLEDALVAVDAGADALGFVFHEKSPRKIDFVTARQIVEKLPQNVERVGVFVDQDTDQIRGIALEVGLSAVQLHGDWLRDSVLRCAHPGKELFGVSKLIAMIPGETLKDWAVPVGSRDVSKFFAFLLDSRTDGVAGGTGKTFDWGAARGAVKEMSLSVPVIVAGGLNPLNVAEAIRTLRPFGVDVSSGVEAMPGKKDPMKTRAFVDAARAESNAT